MFVFVFVFVFVFIMLLLKEKINNFFSNFRKERSSIDEDTVTIYFIKFICVKHCV
jgi:predicted PurR-regulated permease PerM